MVCVYKEDMWDLQGEFDVALKNNEEVAWEFKNNSYILHVLVVSVIWFTFILLVQPTICRKLTMNLPLLSLKINALLLLVHLLHILIWLLLVLNLPQLPLSKTTSWLFLEFSNICPTVLTEIFILPTVADNQSLLIFSMNYLGSCKGPNGF